MFKRQYSDDDIKTLLQMWQDGSTAIEIGEALGKSEYSVRMFMARNRKKYHFEKRGTGNKFRRDSFDTLWHGVIPCGHWIITKPWGTQCR